MILKLSVPSNISNLLSNLPNTLPPIWNALLTIRKILNFFKFLNLVIYFRKTLRNLKEILISCSSRLIFCRLPIRNSFSMAFSDIFICTPPRCMLTDPYAKHYYVWLVQAQAIIVKYGWLTCSLVYSSLSAMHWVLAMRDATT